MTTAEKTIKKLKNGFVADRNTRDPDFYIKNLDSGMTVLGVAVYKSGNDPKVKEIILYLIQKKGLYQEVGTIQQNLFTPSTSLTTLYGFEPKMENGKLCISIKFHQEYWSGMGMAGRFIEGPSRSFEISDTWER